MVNSKAYRPLLLFFVIKSRRLEFVFFPRIFSSSITCQKHAKCPHLKKMSCYVVMFRAAAVLTITTNSGFEILFFHLSIGLKFLQKVCNGIIRYEKTRFSWKKWCVEMLKDFCCLVFFSHYGFANSGNKHVWTCLNLRRLGFFEIILHINNDK